MTQDCEFYIPNNNDYLLHGYCYKLNKQCLYAGEYPEYSETKGKELRAKCKYYQEWIDPINIKE